MKLDESWSEVIVRAGLVHPFLVLREDAAGNKDYAGEIYLESSVSSRADSDSSSLSDRFSIGAGSRYFFQD